jgi:3-deoxy-manno-octulosonate cytidylyltransferase (CMP-KDO synthetase)
MPQTLRPSRLAVIPARFASSRFPGKPLALLLGAPMIEHVFRRCTEAQVFDRIVIATDDARIAEAASAFGAQAVMTSPACRSGTDRAAEVARGSAEDVIINVQGDEPALPAEALRALVEPAFEALATLVRPLRDGERENRNVVKAVLDAGGFATAFTRADVDTPWAHVGLYGYRREVLLKLAGLPQTDAEKAESLEQLRALGNGMRIHCRAVAHATQAVDVPEDVPKAEAALRDLMLTPRR